MFQRLIGSSIFLSALLMFFIQPLLAKHLLPQFGSAGFVWVTSILFFQTGLLLGYLWAYLLVKIPFPRFQVAIHALLLMASILTIPVQLDTVPVISNIWPPLNVLHLLSSTILLPFIVISASSPLLQHWYCRVKQTEFPYYFYSISNAGSLIGLLGYPFLLEPLLGLRMQAFGWTFLYVIYFLLCTKCMTVVFALKAPDASQQQHVSFKAIGQWLGLTALTSALLFAVTQFLSQNVINLPLMWVLPLALYLITFIVTFARTQVYDRFFWLGSFLIWLGLMLWLVSRQQLTGYDVVFVLLALLYSGCMVCHGELIRLKPAPAALTTYYLIIALGGVLGGLLANGIAYLWLGKWWDLYIPLYLITAIAIGISYRHFAKILFPVSIFLAAALVSISIKDMYNPSMKLITEVRNLYSYSRVYESRLENKVPYRYLRHGNTMHGVQFLEKNKELWPTGYYGPNSGVGLAIQYLHATQSKPLKIAVIGLGCGTIAALLNSTDQVDFFEIDPDIKHIADQYFSFLQKSPGIKKIILGDARLEMEKIAYAPKPETYDLIVADAFNGDAVPVHLLTLEALKLYQQLLNPSGILVINTSNNYLNFMPLTKGLAEQLHYYHFWINSQAVLDKGLVRSNWALLTTAPGFEAWLEKQSGFTLKPNSKVNPVLWTDDQNSILPLLFR